jgi:predicted ATP-grasp superfamily ATP-dependent carboligase
MARVLVTSSRMPFALGMIRRLAEAGHEVLAADDSELAPGSHSRYVSQRLVTPSPRDETEAFVDEVERIATEGSVDVIVPAFEEAFYLSIRHERLANVASLFFSPFATLAPLHDKASFERTARRLGLPMAATVIASSEEELRAALERFPRYFARAAFSRGGVSLLTNTGPLAGALDPADCHPTPQNPWLVQEFVDGETFCTYSTVHNGRITAHCAYEIPRQWKHSTGIQFVASDGAETLALAEEITRDCDYTGQISFDFIASPDGPMLVECNPRATDGVLLMGAEQLANGILDPGAKTTSVPAGESIQLDLAVFGGVFADGLREVPKTVRDLIEIRGSDRGWHDALPQLYSFLSLAHYERLQRDTHEALFVAMAGDISWDGEPIAGMSAADSELLAGLGPASPGA